MADFVTQVLETMCFAAQGDLGPLTTYTSRKKIIIYLKDWLDDPKSRLQVEHRDRIRDAARAWQRLCPAARLRWERATHHPRLPLTGYNLFTFWWMMRQSEIIQTIEAQSGQSLLPPLWADDTLCSAACDAENCPRPH